MAITENEALAIGKILSCAGAPGRWVMSKDVNPYDVKKGRFGGVVSSLKKKIYVVQTGNGPESKLSVTKEGADAYRAFKQTPPQSGAANAIIAEQSEKIANLISALRWIADPINNSSVENPKAALDGVRAVARSAISDAIGSAS